MRNRKSLLIVAMVIVATAATLFDGCKKEKDEAAAHADKSEAQALLNRIEAFQTLRDAVNSGAKADGSMTVEEMRQMLDLMSNYEHSEHTKRCPNFVFDTLRITMPLVDDNGNVSENDAVATYNAFETALSQHMLSANDSLNVASLFSIVMPSTNAKGNNDNDIEIIFRRGEESVTTDEPDDEPFHVGQNWIWGKSLGLCKPNPFNVDHGDASTQLSSVIPSVQDSHPGQTPIITDVVHVIYRPCPYEIYFTESIYYEDSIGCSDTWLFYRIVFNDEPCIFYDELNCYYHSFIDHIVSETGPLHYAPTSSLLPPPYYSGSIQWHEFPLNPQQPEIVKIHAAHVTYASVTWPESPSHDE